MQNFFFQSTARMAILCLFAISLNLGLLAQDLDPAQWPSLKGYWKFQDTTNLVNATVGNDLTLVGSHQWVSGASYGDTAIRINIGSYYKCEHGMAPNGGGDSVNQYTLMFDFKVLSLDRWHTFQQTDTANLNDGECFIKPLSESTPGAIGVGYTGYSASTVVPNQWNRLIISVNLGNFYNYYLNGILIHEGDTDEIFIDQRFALTSGILFFADNNQEDDTIDVASIAIFDTCLTPAQIAQIGTIDPCIVHPPIVDLGPDTIVYFPYNIILDAGPGYKSYLWSTGDTSQTITLNTIGLYEVWLQVIDMDDCTGIDTIIVLIMPIGLDEKNAELELKIVPNPNHGKFLVMAEDCIIHISLLDVSGQVVLNRQGPFCEPIEIGKTGLSKGLYFIKVETTTRSLILKVVID